MSGKKRIHFSFPAIKGMISTLKVINFIGKSSFSQGKMQEKPEKERGGAIKKPRHPMIPGLLYVYRSLFDRSFFLCFRIEPGLHPQPNHNKPGNDQPENQVRRIAGTFDKFKGPLKEVANAVENICHVHSVRILIQQRQKYKLI
jgi:hypothetical protein